MAFVSGTGIGVRVASGRKIVCGRRLRPHTGARVPVPVTAMAAMSSDVSGGGSGAGLGAPYLELELSDDSRVSFQVGVPSVNDLAKALNGLIISFRARTKNPAEKQEVLNFVCEDGALRLRVECNPNLFANAFSATAYVVADDGRMRISATAELPKLIDNIKAYKARNGATTSNTVGAGAAA